MQNYKIELKPSNKKFPSPNGKEPHGNSKAAEYQQEQRSLAISRGLASGKTYRQISEELGIGIEQVRRTADGLLEELKNERVRDTEVWRALHLRRCEDNIQAIYDRALGGSLKAQEQVRKWLERESKLLQLDAPTQVDHTVTGVIFHSDVQRAQALGAIVNRLRERRDQARDVTEYQIDEQEKDLKALPESSSVEYVDEKTTVNSSDVDDDDYFEF